MTTFDRREDAFERKYALDAEMSFKAHARRDKLLGLWAAEKLGRSGAEADAYAREVVAAGLEEAGDADVMGKLRRDFAAANVPFVESEATRLLDELLAKAVAELRA